MTLVIRERRHREALRLSLPKPRILPSSDFHTPKLLPTSSFSHEDSSPGDENADEFAGDVWSFGVVMLECFLGHFPFISSPEERPDWATLVCAICFGEKLEMPEKGSIDFQSFVRRCLEKDWRKRATVSELLLHPSVNRDFCSSCKGLVDYVLHG